MKAWFKKRKMIPRWKLILWSLICLLVGSFLTIDFTIKGIFFAIFFIGLTGWQLLFVKD